MLDQLIEGGENFRLGLAGDRAFGHQAGIAVGDRVHLDIDEVADARIEAALAQRP